MKDYNGWSAARRTESIPILTRAMRSGALAQPGLCHMCGSHPGTYHCEHYGPTDALYLADCRKRLRGGSQARVVMANGQYYCAKFADNPQAGVQILANELIAGRLMHAVGLPVPFPVILTYAGGLPNATFALGSRERLIAPGDCVATPLVAETVYDSVPETISLGFGRAFAACYVADRWLLNRDARQSVFFKTERDFDMRFVDNGYSLSLDWKFEESSAFHCYYHQRRVYGFVSKTEDFGPVFERILRLPADFIRHTCRTLPEQWGFSAAATATLAENIIASRKGLLARVRAGREGIFPRWVH